VSNIAGIWPDDNLVGGEHARRATIMGHIRLYVTDLRLRLLRSARYIVLAPFRKAPAAIRIILTRVERGFADFAQIPYEDSLTQRELLQFLDEFEAESHTGQSD
jgi:hypothetical protein